MVHPACGRGPALRPAATIAAAAAVPAVPAAQFMLPAVDMFNHADPGAANSEREHDQHFMYTYAQAPIKAGEEVRGGPCGRAYCVGQVGGASRLFAGSRLRYVEAGPKWTCRASAWPSMLI